MLLAPRSRQRLAKRAGKNQRHATHRSMLAPSESKHLVLYSQLWKRKFGKDPRRMPSAFFNLGDNPEQRLCWSASGRLPGFRRTAGKLWSPWADRWLTGKERLAALGFPVYADMAASAQCQPFSISGQFIKHEAGNSWYVGSAGLVLLVSLSCVAIRAPRSS